MSSLVIHLRGFSTSLGLNPYIGTYPYVGIIVLMHCGKPYIGIISSEGS
jgi:hypothetical protein